MARKKKSAGKKSARTAAQKGVPLKSWGTAAPARKRKSSRYLTLAIMGGAAFFALRSCSDDNDEHFYRTVQQCADDGNLRQVCEEAWTTAKKGLTAGVTSPLTHSQCMVQYGTYGCDYDPDVGGYAPILAGFTLAKAKEKTCDPQYENCNTRTSSSHYYAYNVGGHSWSSRPVWRDRNGDYVYRSGETAERYVSSQPLHKAKTVSRGGWGSSSKSFSSRGS